MSSRKVLKSRSGELVIQSTGAGVLIAILDTGIDLSKPELARRVRGVKDFCNPVRGTGQDTDGHGTHLAGIIARLAKEAELLVGRIMTQNGYFSFDAMSDGIKWAVKNGANIICIASGDRYDDPNLHAVIKQANDEDIIILAAIGNGGGRTSQSGYFPARYAECISVGAVDEKDILTSFCDLNQLVPTICAPGVDIESLSLQQLQRSSSGSSMAVAHIGAILANVVSGLRQTNTRPVAREIIQKLFLTAKRRKVNNVEYYIVDSKGLFESFK